MKVLSFSSCFPCREDPNRGVFVLQRLASLARLNDVEVVHPWGWFPCYRGGFPRPSQASEEIAGLTVHHPKFPYVPGFFKTKDAWLYSRAMGPWLERYIAAEGRPDVLDAHFVWPDGVAVRTLARRFGLPFIVTLRGVLNSRVHNEAMRMLIAAMLSEADAIISVSQPMADIAVELGAPADRITVIPNGVDVDLFAPIAKAEARQAAGLSSDGRYMACVANMRPLKGLTELVTALGELPGDISLVIVGEDGDDGSYRQSLIRIASDGGYANRVIFAGAQPHAAVPTYLCAADVTVLASYSEGCPNVVLEALSCGRPVVATAVGQVPGLVIPDVSGKIVPIRDAGALAGALKSAFATAWDAGVIRNTPAVRSWDNVAADVDQVLQKVVGERT